MKPTSTPPRSFNPRYLSYCKSQGRTLCKQHMHDVMEYPGGQMTGFILWIGDKFKQFQTEHPDKCCNGAVHDQQAFTDYCAK